MSERLQVLIQGFNELSDVEKDVVSNNGVGKKWATYIRVVYDGETICLASDACEPEDKTFNRDFSWIAKAIKHAYLLGVAEDQP